MKIYCERSKNNFKLISDFSPDWLLVSSGILQGVFSVFVAYWGNRIHRTAWLGGLFMLQSVLCLIVVIPTLVHKYIFEFPVDSIS